MSLGQQKVKGCKAIIFTGPSGGGKTTLASYILQEFAQVERSVSVTTRAPRPGEVPGLDYLFIDVEEFHKLIEQDAFVEWEQVYEGLYYGTLRSEIERIWKAGKAVLFVVDVIGAGNLKLYFESKAVKIFVRAPSMKVLEERLYFRGTEDEDSIRKRLKRALGELSYEQQADVVIINDQLDDSKQCAISAVQEFIGHEICRG
jgi:guanylate kinase